MLFNPTGLNECLQEWEDLEKDYQQVQETHRLYKHKLEEVSRLQDSCSSSIARQRKKIKDLNESLQEKFLNSLVIIIFKHCGVTKRSHVNEFAFKDEYEKFKLYLTVLLLLFSFTCRFLVTYRVLDAHFNFLLVWYYCTLTIRESILINNGSKIKGWWVFQHYVSTFLSGVMLTWPDGELYQMFRNQFLSYSMYINFVQFLQYYYQSGCLYRLRALGERHNMDLTVEGFQSWMWRGLTFLLPFLFLGHFFQLYNGITLFQMAQLPEWKEWQVLMCGSTFLVLFMGNFFTTLGVVYHKYMDQDKAKAL
uniref:Transmembrane protein 120A n=1 Tax=Sinocyclocheilus grahami TaxID=75366 RepID=A0A672P9L3_SINGR